MKASKDKGYISDFDEHAKNNPDTQSAGGPIDFSIAQKLEGTTGSTCDTFITTYHENRVFIKRLKAHLKNKVLYKKALEKEFTLGFRLKHSGLPTYIEFHGDYIIMEYIEGDTLAELINKKDPWLSKDRNVKKLLIQLVEILDYLHQNEISHCDVKSDNLLITKGHRNLKLIDLDKCYTSAKNTSAGAPSLYNVESIKTGHPDVDFHGVGILVKRMTEVIPGFPVNKFSRFISLCHQENIEAETLLDWLKDQPKSFKKKGKDVTFIDFLPILIILIILAVIGLVLDSRNRTENHVYIENPAELVKDKKEEIIQPEEEAKGGLSKTMNNHIRDYKSLIAEKMDTRLGSLRHLVDEANLMLNDSLSNIALTDLITKLMEAHSSILSQSYEYFQEYYPNENPIDIQMAVISSPAYIKVTKELDETTKKIADIMNTRHPKTNISEE